jgi:glycosidase
MKRSLPVLAALLCGCPPAEQLADVAAPDAPAADPVEGDADLTPAAQAGWRSQVLYLVMVDRFRDGNAANNTASSCFDRANPRRYHGGDFEGLRQNLSYIRDVGATAVWITPPNKQAHPGGACGYHGYWIDYTIPHDHELAPELGTRAELTQLVSDMHASGMRFVLDMVVNHSGDAARLPTQRPDWFHDPATCAQLGPAMVYCPLDHHPDFKQERSEVAAYLSEIQAQTAHDFAIDGIRMDTAKHVPASYYRDSFLPAVRAARPDVFTVAEIYEPASTTSYRPYLDAGFDSAFHFPVYAAIRDAIGRSGSVDLVAHAVADGISVLGIERALDLVLFIDNHDVPRFANVPGHGVPEAEIRARLLLALDLLFTLPGIPQLYYGDELGMYGGGDPDNRRDLPAWAMEPAQRAQPHPGTAVAGSAQIYQRVQKLSSLRRTVPALVDGRYRELWRQNGPANPNVYAFARGQGDGIRIVVISNGARPSGTVRIPLPGIADGTTLEDELGDGAPTSVVVTGGRLVVDMPARSAAIYRIKP